MSETWYRTNRWGDAVIEPVGVLRETPKYVWVKYRYQPGEHRVQKDGDTQYFPTWQAAHEWLVARAGRRLEAAEDAVRQARTALEEVRAMQDPTEAA